MTYEPHNINQLNQVKPSYLSAYGLTEAPFSQQHDDRFLYLNAALTERLELLKHYTQYGNLLLIVTGERGIGKSSLKQRFINTAQEEWQVCEIQSHTMMDAGLLLKQVAQGFNITDPPHEPAALFEVLSSQLQYMHQASYIPILIIDDAHELPKDALQSLLYLAEHHSDQETALRIILFCEPEIEIMLDDPAIHSLRERVTHSLEIPSLDEAETAEYLRHRLAVAGLDGTSPFTPKLINKIFKASEGIPSRINEYAHQNLLNDSEPVTSEEFDLTDELIHETTPYNLRNMLLGGFALAIVITGLLFQNEINRLFEEPEKITAKPVPTPGNIKIDKTDIAEIAPDTKGKPEEFKPVEEKTIEFDLNKDPAQQIKPSTEIAKKTSKDAPLLKLAAINPNTVTASKQRQIISISGAGFHKRQKVKVVWTGKEKILTDSQVTFTSDTYINLILNVGMQTDTWKVTVIDPVNNIESNTISFTVVSPEKEMTSSPAKITKQEKTISNATITMMKAVKHNGLYGQNWIKQQNKNHFTLQLLGTHQQSALPDYVKKFALKNDAAMFKTKRNGKDWFTLIYGHYPTKSAAQTAANQLPTGVNKPWIRSFASILPLLRNSNTNAQQRKSSTQSTVISTPLMTENKEGWLWSQDPSHYTLQLTAGTDKRAIEAFVKRHNLTGKAIYFHKVRDGKDWYILIHGSYPGYSTAQQAIRQLPLAVQKAKPWTRTFSAIHAELN
ncbi:MAG: SPOR domain-containing protein [Gammaproteobacteria bacterium]|nr:SPOR domain-containing protein [Gammaproteobacteria bacterium]